MERQRKRTAGVTSQETRTLWLPDPSFLAAAHRPAKHAFCGGGEDVSFAYSSMDSWIFVFYTPSYNLIHLDFIAQIVPALVTWVLLSVGSCTPFICPCRVFFEHYLSFWYYKLLQLILNSLRSCHFSKGSDVSNQGGCWVYFLLLCCHWFQAQRRYFCFCFLL